MSAPELIAYAVVLFIGVPAMLKNWTAVALVGSFLIVHLAWIVTGETSLPLDIMCDYAVVIVVLVKPPANAEIRGIWLGLSKSDKIIILLFAPAWAAYVIGMSDWLRYWIMWSVGLLQFFVAGAEAFSVWRQSRAAEADVHPADRLFRQEWAVNEW